MYNEWPKEREILRGLKRADDPERTAAGIPLYARDSCVYVEDSSQHIIVQGATGQGKTQCLTLPYVDDILAHGESLIMIDRKGEVYERMAGKLPPDAQLVCLDFSAPSHSKNGWNPLQLITDCLNSADGDTRDAGNELMEAFLSGIVRREDHGHDQYWTHTARDLLAGLILCLNKGSEKVTVSDLNLLLSQLDNRQGRNTLAQRLSAVGSDQDLYRTKLDSYINTASDTRSCIHSCAVTALNKITVSEGVLKLMNGDEEWSIADLNLEKPFFICAIVPDETSNYDVLAGVLVGQLAYYLEKKARSFPDGCLPRRVNVLVEEAGTIFIPSLVQLMAAARSRNIRMTLILQDAVAQLTRLYSPGGMEAITGNAKINVVFASNSQNLLAEWSGKCGNKLYEHDGTHVLAPLLSIEQLWALPEGRALINIQGHQALHYIAQLPMYYESHGTPAVSADIPMAKRCVHEPFSAEAFFEHLRDLHLDELAVLLSKQARAADAKNTLLALCWLVVVDWGDATDLLKTEAQIKAVEFGKNETGFSRYKMRKSDADLFQIRIEREDGTAFVEAIDH